MRGEMSNVDFLIGVFQSPEDIRPGGHGQTLRVRVDSAVRRGEICQLRPRWHICSSQPQLPGLGERLGLRRRLGADPRDAPGGRLGGQDVSKALCGKPTSCRRPGFTASSRLFKKKKNIQFAFVSFSTRRELAVLFLISSVSHRVSLCFCNTAVAPLRRARGARG